jgi:plastocyanin
MVNAIKMKTKILLLLLLLSVGLAGHSTTWQITNSGFSFSPATVTIQLGDNVNFTLDPIHDAVEVSFATWTAGGSTSNGGFMVDYGGGLVSTSQLTVGTHYYVCEPHASFGMKGQIVVVNATEVIENKMPQQVVLTPNPVRDFIQVTVSENDLLGSGYLVFNQLGRQVMTGRLTDKITRLAVNQLPSGVYFIQIANLKNQTFKVLIQK